MLCPKMKVPMSTDTAPQTSKQHLPSQQSHVSTHVSGVWYRQATHTEKHHLKPCRVIDLGEKSGYPSPTCRDGFLKQQERKKLRQ